MDSRRRRRSQPSRICCSKGRARQNSLRRRSQRGAAAIADPGSRVMVEGDAPVWWRDPSAMRSARSRRKSHAGRLAGAAQSLAQWTEHRLTGEPAERHAEDPGVAPRLPPPGEPARRTREVREISAVERLERDHRVAADACHHQPESERVQSRGPLAVAEQGQARKRHEMI